MILDMYLHQEGGKISRPRLCYLLALEMKIQNKKFVQYVLVKYRICEKIIENRHMWGSNVNILSIISKYMN
jgi:hypothetical protein